MATFPDPHGQRIRIPRPDDDASAQRGPLGIKTGTTPLRGLLIASYLPCGSGGALSSLRPPRAAAQRCVRQRRGEGRSLAGSERCVHGGQCGDFILCLVGGCPPPGAPVISVPDGHGRRPPCTLGDGLMAASAQPHTVSASQAWPHPKGNILREKEKERHLGIVERERGSVARRFS
jgi:hypothetical protein